MKWNLLFLGLIIFACCNSNKQITTTAPSSDNSTKQENKVSDNKPIDFSSPPFVIIYKTKKDYSDKVPVTLNDDKTKIVSYPGTKDVFYNGKLSLPEKLNDGFLLDNRGIDKNVAFLNITYEEYSRQTENPSQSQIMKMIIDKDPLTEMYNCGSRYQYKDIVNELNKIIADKQLNKFKKVK